MYKHCTTEAGEQRQRQFECCLLELMAVRPYRQISVSDLCARMALSRKAFYHYFSSLDDCLTALIDHTVMDLLTAEAKDDASYLQYCFAYWRQHSELLEALLRNRLTDVLLQRSAVCAQEAPELSLISRAITSGQLAFIVCGFTGLLMHWHQEGYRQSPAQLAQELEELFR